MTIIIIFTPHYISLLLLCPCRCVGSGRGGGGGDRPPTHKIWARGEKGPNFCPHLAYALSAINKSFLVTLLPAQSNST